MLRLGQQVQLHGRVVLLLRASSGPLSRVGVSILPTTHCLRFADFSKRSEHFLGQGRFPRCGARHLGPQQYTRDWAPEG